ncbi:MAG: NAD(+)/NADH kinase [Rhodothermia bacterium]
MIYGITGNPNKNLLWEPAAELIGWLLEQDLEFRLHASVADGLTERGLVAASVVEHARIDDLAGRCDLVLSFGGDGTLLNTARILGSSCTPILGVNIGRLGFLTGVEVELVREAIQSIEAGRYEVEKRLTLEAQINGHPEPLRALNEILITRTGSAQMISIEVTVDGVFLNRYRSDGIIIATSTGSTAYSLSAGGPIIAPGSGVIVVTPVAPHTLTARPVVLPNESQVSVRVMTPGVSYTVAADGEGPTLDRTGIAVTVSKSKDGVRLVKLEGRDYFDTLRKKLAWGAGG